MSRKERNVCIVLFLAISIIVVLRLCGANKKIIATETYTVRCGDTLWDIAETYKPNGSNARNFIDSMYELNDDLTSVIYPGQSIIIPLYEE